MYAKNGGVSYGDPVGILRLSYGETMISDHMSGDERSRKRDRINLYGLDGSDGLQGIPYIPRLPYSNIFAEL